MGELNLPVGYVFGEHNEYQVIRRQPLNENVNNTFAEVYLVKKIKVRKRFALKVLRPEVVVKSARSVDDFQEEIRVLMSLEHKNIIRIDDFGTLVDRNGMPSFYLIMEYIEDGGILKDSYSFRKKMNLFLQILDGLEFLHGKDILHRDIKPDNILVEHDTIVKIADFGIAKLIDEESPVSSAIGAPAYAPPEQVKRLGHLSYASDLYAAGKTLYTMLTGSIPGVNEQITALPAPFDEEPWVAGITRILAKATAYEPRARYRTAAGMREDIRREFKSPARKKAIPENRPRGTKLFNLRLVAAVALLLVVVLFVSDMALDNFNARTDANVPAYSELLNEGIKMFHDTAAPESELISHFDRLVVDFRPDAKGLYYAGLTAALSGEHTAATERLRRAVELKPDDPGILTALGKAYYTMGAVQRARIVWRKAYKLNYNDAQIRALLRLTGNAR